MLRMLAHSRGNRPKPFARSLDTPENREETLTVVVVVMLVHPVVADAGTHDPSPTAPRVLPWSLRLTFGVLGATATLSGPALRAYVLASRPPEDAVERGLPLDPLIFLIAGWGAVWLMSILAVTYQRETNVVSLAVTALGIPGTFAGLSVLTQVW